VGEPERRFLLDIGHLDAPAAAVSDGLADLLMGITHHDADVLDAGGRQGLDPVKKNGLVCDRDELLRGGVRDGAKPGSASSGEDQPFHFSADYSSLATASDRE
jgi:hypothetical protein